MLSIEFRLEISLVIIIGIIKIKINKLPYKHLSINLD